MRLKLLFILLNLVSISLFAQDFLPGVPQNDLDIIQNLNGSAKSNDSKTLFRPTVAYLSPQDNTHYYVTINYKYSNDGYLIEELYKNTRDVTTNYTRNTYTYNYTNLIAAKLTEKLVNNNWVNVEIYTYSYNYDNNLHSVLLQKWINNNWINVNRILYGYDIFNNLIDKYNENWIGNIWKNVEHYNYVYDINNNKIFEYYLLWNTTWESKWRYSYFYNDQNFLTKRVQQVGTEGNWIDSTQITLEYNEIGKLRLKKTYAWHTINAYWNEIYEELFSYNPLGSIYYSVNRYPYSPLNYRYNYDYKYSFDSNNNCISATSTIYDYSQGYGLPHIYNSPMYVYYNNNSEFLYLTAAIISVQYATFSDVNDDLTELNDFNLSQNYPNPFNPATTIKYSIPSANVVTLKVFDVLGAEVANLINEYKNAGTYEVNFDGSNLTTGVYFYKLQTGNFTQTKKLLLLK
ncbi:MAG: T9SS type A sorting domain-containing protein [bacterium]